MTRRLSKKHARASKKPDGEGVTFREMLRGLAVSRSSIMSVFSDFCRITACCLAMETREEEYLERIKGYSKDELDHLAKAMGLLITEMESKPFEDVLGVYYTEAVASADKHARGEFYTPRNISTMMGKMVLDIEKIKNDNQPVTISDPCCGSGSMILACAQELSLHHDLMRVTLQDINPVACDMAYINMALWGIPAQIVLGDTLKAECRAHWKNIHWHRVGEDQRQQSLKMLAIIREMENPGPNQPPSPADPGTRTFDSGSQAPAVSQSGPNEQFGLF